MFLRWAAADGNWQSLIQDSIFPPPRPLQQPPPYVPCSAYYCYITNYPNTNQLKATTLTSSWFPWSGIWKGHSKDTYLCSLMSGAQLGGCNGQWYLGSRKQNHLKPCSFICLALGLREEDWGCQVEHLHGASHVCWLPHSMAAWEGRGVGLLLMPSIEHKQVKPCLGSWEKTIRLHLLMELVKILGEYVRLKLLFAARFEKHDRSHSLSVLFLYKPSSVE